MALLGLFFLSLILFPVLAHWMLAMAVSYSFLEPDFVSDPHDTM